MTLGEFWRELREMDMSIESDPQVCVWQDGHFLPVSKAVLHPRHDGTVVKLVVEKP